MEPTLETLPTSEMVWTNPEPCAPLFPVQPAGTGTAFAEGLLSWLIRAAREHAVSPRDLVAEVIAERAPSVRMLCYGTFFRHYAATIDGLGSYAALFAGVLREMAALGTLDRYTMLPWRFVIAAQGSPVIGHRVRWCSRCLRDMIGSGVEPYRMLLWSLHAVELCPVHLTALEVRCPHCAAEQPAIPRWPDIIYCDSCRRTLLDCEAEHGSRPAADRFSTETLWRAYAAADMIRFSGSGNAIASTAPLRCFVREMAYAVSQGNRAELCRLIGLPPQALNKWMTGHDKPSMPLLLKLLYSLETWPSHVFTTDHHQISTFGLALRQPGDVKRRVRGPRLVSDVAAVVEAAVLADDPHSLRQLAETVGMTRAGIKYRFPEECRHIVEARRAKRGVAMAAKVHNRQAMVAGIVRRLHESGAWPGRKRVESESRKIGLSLMAGELRRAYHQALVDLVL